MLRSVVMRTNLRWLVDESVKIKILDNLAAEH